MAERSKPVVQDETLRLILSSQEEGYIQKRRASARKALIFWSILALIGGIGVAIFGIQMDEYQNVVATGVIPEDYYTAFFSLSGAIVLMAIALLKLPLTILACRKYRRYDEEHAAFLGKYDRKA